MPPLAHTCIVVPAYNEATRFDGAALIAFVDRCPHIDFILVNDGSTDDTLTVLQNTAAERPARVQVLSYPQNRGKAEAVRVGMQAAVASGATTYAGYWDADWATPLLAVETFVRFMDAHPEVNFLLGSRVALLGRHIDRKPARHYLGRVAATAASLTLGLPVYDTQCGAKLLRLDPKTRSLFEQPFATGWVFDVELIARYTRLHGSADGLYELPVDRWTDVGESRVRPVDFMRAFGDLATVYRAHRMPAHYHGLVDLLTSRFVRYLWAGAVGTVGHYATLVAGVELCALAPATAAGLGATVGALINYLLNYHLIFTSRSPHRSTLPRFAAVAGLGIALNAAMVELGTAALGWHYFVAQLAATLVTVTIGYTLNRLWTFRSS